MLSKKNLWKNLWIWMAVIFVATIAITGCIGEKTQETTPTQTPKTIVTVTPQGIMEKYSLEKLVSISDSIAIGTILDVSSKWNTPDGKKLKDDYIIYTDIDIKVEEYLKNPLTADIITVRILGGVIGKDKLEVEDQPSFKIGENILIFLKEDTDPRTKDVGIKHLVTAGLFQGKITIENKEVIIEDKKMTLDDAKAKIKELK